MSSSYYLSLGFSLNVGLYVVRVLLVEAVLKEELTYSKYMLGRRELDDDIYPFYRPSKKWPISINLVVSISMVFMLGWYLAEKSIFGDIVYGTAYFLTGSVLIVGLQVWELTRKFHIGLLAVISGIIFFGPLNVDLLDYGKMLEVFLQ